MSHVKTSDLRVTRSIGGVRHVNRGRRSTHSLSGSMDRTITVAPILTRSRPQVRLIASSRWGRLLGATTLRVMTTTSDRPS